MRSKFTTSWLVHFRFKVKVKVTQSCLTLCYSMNYTVHRILQARILEWVQFSSVLFSVSVVSDSLRPLGMQHTRPPCPSPTPKVCSNSCPLSQWCHPTISFSVVPFSSCPQSFPVSESFQLNQFFASGGQSIGVSAATSVPLMNV